MTQAQFLLKKMLLFDCFLRVWSFGNGNLNLALIYSSRTIKEDGFRSFSICLYLHILIASSSG